ncbi:immunoglobulin-like domain-containing protein [uncultured Clostridium sp.]|uniref:immunoglobulin-like domain-containing protein n=1 Tax=uncultured Clostridium sp. TaxID=59620 RepID=UPI002672D986|nr:immunoglobulin-like domain-containing protein [uncultured Clostridium sp.]
MNKKLVSIICAATLFSQTLPVDTIAKTIKESVINSDKSQVDAEENNKEEDDSSTDEVKKNEKTESKEELGLDKVTFNAYIDKTNELLFSIGFDEKEKKFAVSEQSEKNISEEAPEETMYRIKIFDKEQKEKFSVELKGKDTGNSEKLEPLKSLNYEVGDFIQITPTDSKDVLKITGNIQGDVDKQKEDYSDGIDNYDYIGNVRFQVEEDHLKTVYNEAPVINGLTDIEESENPMNDILTGISIKDDHDGDIDNSKIVPLITELEDGVLDVSYTVEDSWGRKVTGKRKISPKKVEQEEVKQEEVKQEEVKQEEPQIIREEINLRTGNANNSTSQNTTGLAANEITVEGTPYFNGQHVRFKIRFDTTAKQIQIVDQDGRKLSNTGNNEYFRFVLYDKDMNEKASVSLLGNDKSDSDKLDKIANQLYEEGDFIGVWHAETKIGNGNADDPENNASLSSFIPKLKIGGTVRILNNDGLGNLSDATETKNYSNGMDKKDISERRFQITSNGLKEVVNTEPKFGELSDVVISRGVEFDPLKDVKDKITDDFNEFNDDNLESKAVSITYSSYDVKKVGEQTITYTATDKWGKSSTKTRKLTVTSENPMDSKYIEFKNGDKSLFKIKFDSVEKKFLVDNLETVQEEAIDSTVSSSIFKLKIYTKGGVLQKTLNIKGTDNLKAVLKKFDGYKYNVEDYIEVWSNNPKNIVIHGVDRDTKPNGTVEPPSSNTPGQGETGNSPQPPNGGESSGGTQNGSGSRGNNGEEASEQNVREGNLTQSGNLGQSSSTIEDDSDKYENYENGIDNPDFMKNVRFKLQDTKLVYVYNSAPEIKIDDKVNLEFDRNQKINEEELKKKLMNGITVSDDHDDDGELLKKVIVGNIDLTTIGEKEVEYRVVDSWGRSSLVKRKVTVYPLNSLEYNYITLRNNETFDPILTIRLNDKTKKFVVDKIDRSKIPSSLSNDTKVFELKLIRKKNENSSAKASEENSVGKGEEVIGTITLTKEDLMNDEKIKEINKLSYEYSDYISLWVYDSEDGIFISGKSNIILNGFEASRSQEAMKNTRFEIKETGLESIYNEAPKINGRDEKLYVYKNDDITQKVATRGLTVEDDSGDISIDSIEVTDVDGKIVKPENDGNSLKSKFKFKLKSENSNEDKYIKTDEIEEFKLNYKVTDAWGRSATYQRTVSVISRSVSNDIEFYNKDASEKLFSLKYNPITNTFDVSKKKNSQPSQEEQQPGELESSSEQPSQGADSSNGEQVQAKTGDVDYGNETEETPPSSGEEGSSSGTSRPEEGATPPKQDSITQSPDNSQGGQQPGGIGGSNNQQTNDKIVFKLTVFNVKEQEVGKIELTEEEASNIDKIKEKLKNITIYDNYYVALWSNTPKRIRIQGEVKDNDKLGNEGNETIDYSKGTDNSDYIDNVRFLFTVDGVNAIYNKAPEIIVTSKERLTSYAGDIIDYTKNIKVVDDRDNEDNDHVIDNSKIKVTIIPKETNSVGTQTDNNGSASGSGSSNTEGNGDSDGTDRNPGSEIGDTSSSEDTGNQGQTTENEEAAFVNDESSSETTDSSKNDASSDKDNSNKTEEEKFLEEQKKHLKIGINKIKLTVADSWGRTTTIERNLLILNGIDKNEIIFKGGDGQEPIRIKFNHETKKLNIITQDRTFGSGDNPNYVKIAVYNKDGNTKVNEITFNTNETPNSNNKLTDLKNYNFEYGDYFKIYHGHPQLFYITGGINDQREDYTDGVQNPENLLDVKFEITESGLKSIYTNPDKNNISDNKVVFGPVAQEKFPFKIQIDFENNKFKVIDATGTFLKYGDEKIVYKIALIRKNTNGTTTIVRENEFRGTDFGKSVMHTEDENGDKNWNGQSFQYDDCLYLWHYEPSRSIIKGNIKNEREDYSNGVDNPDNMNHVVFRLTPKGLESIYNEAPKIEGVGDIDVYQGEEFYVGEGVEYTDDHDDDNNLIKSVALKQNGSTTVTTNTNSNSNNNINWKLDTSELGEKILVYTARDRWGKTTTVERKVTVRPNLYKNVFKVYPQIGNEQAGTKPGENGDSNSSIESPNPEVTTPPNSNLKSGNTDDSTLNSGSESSGNTGSSSSNSGGNSSTQNKPWQYEENENRKPAFEIGFDTITNKYKVYNQTNERLSNDKLDETAFAIQIKNANGTEKKKIILTGNDRGTSPKLSELNDVSYADNDIIRVYRSDLKGIEITGTVTGNIPSIEDMSTEANRVDYMKNTGFKVSNAGLQAIYNKAPVITGVKKVRTISKGTVDLLDGINVSDEIDTDISVNYMYIYVNDELIGTVNQNRNSNENSHREYDFNKVGTYKVKYLLYDKWARTTMIETTVKVESKTRENEIKVYGPNDLNSTSNPEFRIVFDTKNNKILLKGPSEESIVDKEDSDDAIESANQENNNTNNNQNSEQQDSSLARTSTENYFEIVVRSSKGEEKANISLNDDTEHNKGELKKLHELQFDKYDTISLKAKDPKAVKITGNIISENSNGNSTVANSYENGFGTTDKYSQVRFKITDDGLKEITQKNLVINGATNTTIKRGDTLDLLEGISVNVNDQNNDDYKLTVEEITSNTKTVTTEEDENNTDDSSQNGTTPEDKNKFTKLKEGTYTVKYTATNSWGVTTTVNRVITVEPRTDLEKVKLTVKDRDNNNVLVIGFDSITRKLRVIEHTNSSINYLDDSQVFEINAYDSLGKTLGTIALKGSQTIDQTIINRINAFPYEEGYSLSVWSKELENRINIDGTIKVDNSSKEESKKIRYKRNLSAEQKKDKMENGRFEILSDGLKYIYNEAPKFEGGTSIAIPYYKGNLLKAPDTLKVTDDHDGIISPTEVTVNDDNVDYDTLGIQNITYVVEDSWGRRAEKPGKIEIRSAMDSNSINIYPKENSTTSGSTSESIQQPNQSSENTTEGETSQTRTTEAEGDSENTTHTPGDGGSVTEGTQTPAGSTDGSTETAPGENGGNSNQESSGEGDTTTPGDGNNIDNAVVKNSSFSIKFIRDNEYNKNIIQVVTGSNAEKQFDSNNLDGIFLTVKIYDVNGKVLKSVDILGNDTGVTAKKKIEDILNNVNSNSKNETESEETEQPQTKTNSDGEDSIDNSINSGNGSSQVGSNSNNDEFEYFNGQYIAIEGVTEATMKFVKIQGTVVNKDNDVTYENGVSDIDKIQNVRFKFTDLGLEAVYNNAPTIKIDKDIKLDGTKRNTNSNVEENLSQPTRTTNTEDFDGTKGDDFNYLRGVTISDDHDTLTKDNVEVKWNEKFVGDNTNYENAEETVLEKSSDGEYTLAGNGIKAYGEQKVGENTLYYKVTDSWGRVTFGQRKNIMLKNGIFQNVVRFDTDGKIIMKFEKVETNEQEVGKIKIKFEVSDFDRLTNSTYDKYYGIKVIEPDERTTTVTLNGDFSKTSVCNALSTINEKEFPYGTKIEFYAGHPQIFSIDGPVRNAAEDYSDKVQNPENLINTKFEITDSGLKAIYVPPATDQINESENLISLVAPEKIPLKIKISPRTNNTRTSNGGTISIIDSNGTQIDYGVSNVVFTMILKGKKGEIKKNININGNVNGNAQSIRDQFNGFNYEYGDTLTISHTTPKKVIIKGNIKGAREDYSDGVDNSLNLTEAVFKLTPTGLEAVYRSAPQIMGMIDIEVEKGKSIDYEQLKQSVTAKDNIDGPITNIQYSAENIDTSKVGMYEFTYTVTNSNQRTTTKSSTITVYDLPTIQKNENATIELNSINNNKDVIEDYLKTAVVASDGDDELYGKKTKLEVKDNNVNPNKEGKYEATYVATDLYGKTTEKEVDIQVVRTINVTVPTKLPFQVVTNLMPSEDETTENDGFVSGVLKLKNNNTSPVKVTVESFAKKADSGELEIVDPDSCNWENIGIEESMKKMALGIYVKEGTLAESNYNTESNPLWLSTDKQSNDTSNMDSPGDSEEPSSRTGANEDSNENQVNVINTSIGVLPRRETMSSEPKEASIGFISKHGKNFKGGSVTGKFQLVFKFE